MMSQKAKTWARVICLILALMFVVPTIAMLISSNI